MPRTQLDTIDLVDQIYEAVTEPEQWNVFLGNLTRSMNSIGARMRMIDKRESCYCLVAGVGHDEQFDRLYNAHYNKVDVWNPVLNPSRPGELFNSSEIVPNREFCQTEIYNDLFRDYGLFYGFGSNIIKSDNFIARIGIHRNYSQGEYGSKEAHLLQTLLPHLQRAFNLTRHIEEMKSWQVSMQEALYRSSQPLILFDEYGKVVYTNQQAEKVLANESGLFIINNRLVTNLTAETIHLEKLLSEAVATTNDKGTGSGGAMRVTATDGKQRYNLLVTPYPARSAAPLGLNSRISAAVFIHDSKQAGNLPAEVLQSIYGLTRSEIKLAEAVMEGLSPAEAAAKFGVSVNTTRTQLRALFSKTDTQRQSELVRLLAGLVR